MKCRILLVKYSSGFDIIKLIHVVATVYIALVSNNLSYVSITGVPETKHRQIRFQEALERVYERLWRTDR